MNREEHGRFMAVAGWLLVVILMVMATVACSGDDTASDTATTLPAASGGESAAGTTTSSAVIDALSSFRSKDPFIPQAQATSTSATTAAPTTTTAATTSTTLRPTTTTTAPHRLQVTQIPVGSNTVSFTLDGNTLSGFEPGPALFTGPWGAIQITAVQDAVFPYTASFSLNGGAPFTLSVGDYRVW